MCINPYSNWGKPLVKELRLKFTVRSTLPTEIENLTRLSTPLEALNWTSGETVAIKQISIENIPVGELSDIMVRDGTLSLC
jgi:hypothetical protein